mmetsp:Transcript_27422/g.38563  ORF Transcript_27422/g.38563 Transcript_27422/m.38563 type:complete len:834 (+) Transcript_27422:315-2816(+)
MIIKVAFAWLSLASITVGAKVTTVSNNEVMNVLRGSHGKEAKAFSNLPLKHPIRRLYGPENVNVRRERQIMEEKAFPPTGIHSNVVSYKNHPYDKSTRKLDDSKQDSDDLFQPLRIHFYTGKLESQRTPANSAKIDFIEKTILPRTAEFWSNALSVVPVDGNLKISAKELTGREFCGDSEFTTPPDEHFATGVEDTDLILYVSGTDSYRFCSGNTLAVAVACNFDQFDRPTAGAINFCLDQVEVLEDTEQNKEALEHIISDNLDVAIHEAAHVLGMSSNSYRYFYDSETGQPRTARPLTSRTVTCVDGEERTLTLPDDSTMKFFSATNGQRYASIVTPKVQQVVRNQFDCQTLAGAQLENQPTGTDSCTGDHWDERQFYSEAMSGIISVTTNKVSHLTLALMEDSGWYKANFTMGQMDPFGLGAGCEFATNPCLIKPTSGSGASPEVPSYSRGYFCNTEGKVGCSAALTHKLACAITDYNDMLPKRLPETQFQYFDSPSLGGPRQADYCPVYSFTHSGKSDIHDLACNLPNGDSFSYNFEEYGADSKCVETSSGAGCYRMACIKDEMAVKIFFRDSWYTCEEDFQRISVSTGLVDFKLTCPRLSQACPDLFCPFNCAGRGICNFQNVVNGTIRPKCECFDSSDTSEGCSDSLIPDGEYLDNSNGLINTYNENVLDPLISVFVDHPDRWTTAAWGYAIGLLVLFLIMIGCMCSGCLPQRKSSADLATSKPPKIAEEPAGATSSKRRKKQQASPPPFKGDVPPSQRPSSRPSRSSRPTSPQSAIAQHHQRQNQQIRSAHGASKSGGAHRHHQGASRPPPTRKTPPSTNPRYMYDV